MPSASKGVVLVVDDDEDNAHLLQLGLEHQGFRVEVASSLEEARRMLASCSFDAIVTDLSLGDGTALELLTALGGARPRVAILVTGHGGDEDRERSAAAGFDAHFVKPIELAALGRTLTAALVAS